MSAVRLPLVGVHNQRGIDGQAEIIAGKDQRFVNCTFDLVKNPITGKATVYVERRPGWGVQATVEAGSISTGSIRTDQIGSIVSAFGSPDSNIYDGTTLVGTITGEALHFSETILGSIGYVLIKSSDGTAWYYAEDAGTPLTYTGDTHTNTTIDNIASTAGMYSGQLIAGSGIVVGTRILTVDSSNAITTNTATTATAAGVTITKTPVAKILDTDFVTTGSNISTFVAKDGYVFYCNDDGYVRNSDLNSIISYTAGNAIAANANPDAAVAIALHGGRILCFGDTSIEPFYNAGNATGSPLSKTDNLKRYGAHNQRGIVSLEDDLYFVSSSREGDIKVYRMRDMQPHKISTPHIDTILGNVSSAGGNIYLNAFNLGGYSYVTATVTVSAAGFLLQESGDYLFLENGDQIILEVPATQSRLLVYNVELNIWNEWDTTLLTFIRGLGSNNTNQIFATSYIEDSGKIYKIDPSGAGELYQDDGEAYTMTIQTAKIDHGTRKRKFDHSISLVTDIETTGTATLYKSDDDYATWQTLGTFDLSKKHPMITRCGSYQGHRAYKLEHSTNGAFRAEALDIEMEIGTA